METHHSLKMTINTLATLENNCSYVCSSQQATFFFINVYVCIHMYVLWEILPRKP